MGWSDGAHILRKRSEPEKQTIEMIRGKEELGQGHQSGGVRDPIAEGNQGRPSGEMLSSETQGSFSNK